MTTEPKEPMDERAMEWCIEDLTARLAEVEKERDEAREKASAMHRRAQKAEAELATRPQTDPWASAERKGEALERDDFARAIDTAHIRSRAFLDTIDTTKEG